MPKTIRTCRVCGKKYEACATTTRDTGAFMWREVACSPKCGAIYFEKIKESRKAAPAAAAKAEPISSPAAVAEPAEEPMGDEPNSEATQEQEAARADDVIPSACGDDAAEEGSDGDGETQPSKQAFHRKRRREDSPASGDADH